MTYMVNLYNTVGTKLAVLDNFRYLEVEHNINKPSTHRVDFDATDLDVSMFGTDYIIEVMRRVPDLGIDWYQEYAGFHRSGQQLLTEGQHDRFVTYGRSFLDLIRRRCILYYAGQAKNGPADSVIVEYVDENAGPGATQPPRLYPGVTTGLTVQQATGNAPVWDGERSWVNLLDAIQEIGLAHGVDFDVIWDGAVGFTFYTKYPQLGTDRRFPPAANVDPVVFSTHFGNMVAPSFTHSRLEEVNTVIVLGAGNDEDRETLFLRTDAVDDSIWNQIETTHDARMQDFEASLLDEGRAKLEDTTAKEEFPFTVLQTPTAAYGKHYFHGDIVTATYKDIVRPLKITGVRLVATEGRETVTFTFESLKRDAVQVVIEE